MLALLCCLLCIHHQRTGNHITSSALCYSNHHQDKNGWRFKITLVKSVNNYGTHWALFGAWEGSERSSSVRIATERFHGHKANTIMFFTLFFNLRNSPPQFAVKNASGWNHGHANKGSPCWWSSGPFTCKSPSIPILRVNLGRTIMDPDSIS